MKKFISLLLTLLLSTTALADFKDVTWENVYIDAINNLQEKEIVSGYRDGTYGYDKDISRAEILKILVEAKIKLDPSFSVDLESFKQNCFADVSASDWYSKYVCYAKDEGLVSGFSGNLFKPNQAVTLVEALKMAMLNFDYEYEETDKWYRGLVQEASEMNIIPIDTEYFHNNFKRGQMADLITRIENYESETLPDYLGELANYVVTYDNLRMQENLYNEVVDDCKAPYVLGMIHQTAFYFQNAAKDCFNMMQVYTRSIEDILPEFGFIKYHTDDIYTYFYKTNIINQTTINSLLSSKVYYSDEIMNSFDTDANASQYKSLPGIFYVNFPAEYSNFKAIEYPLYEQNFMQGASIEEKTARHLLEAQDRFESIEDCEDYNFPSLKMFKIKDYYQYCKELGFRG